MSARQPEELWNLPRNLLLNLRHDLVRTPASQTALKLARETAPELVSGTCSLLRKLLQTL